MWRWQARKDTVFAGGLLLLAVLCAYYPVTRAGFIWDDDDYVTQNTTLKDLPGLARIWFEPGAVPQYYPMVHTTFWMEHHLWGLRPLGYHVVNLLLHALAAFLLWLCLRRLRVPGSWFIAAVFALHPMQVESVAWVTERKNVLSAVFYFAALLAFLPHFEQPRHTGRVLLALGLFVCALLSKTVSGTLPVVILLIHYWKTGRTERRVLWLTLPFFLLATVGGLVTVFMERHLVRAVGQDWDLSLLDRMQIAGRALWFYPAKLLLPLHLSFVYPRWSVGTLDVLGLAGLAAAITSVLLLYRMRDRVGRGPLCAALFYGVTISPALGFINIYPMRYTFVADHYQYLAGIGIWAGIIGGSVVIAGQETRRPGARTAHGGWRTDGATKRRVLGILGAVLLIVLGGLSWRRGLAYRDQETLWLDTLEENPTAWMAHHNLGKYYEDKGEQEAALRQYRAALMIRADLDQTLYNLANLEAARGDLGGAERDYRRALRVNPGFAEAQNNLGNALYKQGRTEEAIAAYTRAIELDPQYWAAHRNLGVAQADAGDPQGAVRQLKVALEADSSDALTGARLAWLLATSNDSLVRDGKMACRLAERACRLTNRSNANCLVTLSAAYAETGRYDVAAATMRQAITLVQRGGSSGQVARLESYLANYREGRAIRTGK